MLDAQSSLPKRVSRPNRAVAGYILGLYLPEEQAQCQGLKTILEVGWLDVHKSHLPSLHWMT